MELALVNFGLRTITIHCDGDNDFIITGIGDANIEKEDGPTSPCVVSMTIDDLFRDALESSRQQVIDMVEHSMHLITEGLVKALVEETEAKMRCMEVMRGIQNS